ncbi:YdaS family helix-turn-helix protein [Enterobacter asburiae]|uniref:YdaS family helix-turn-helix protein n=1 Tax=Enterobacter asburiae TaxID=61645 RepID=UPI003B22FE15
MINKKSQSSTPLEKAISAVGGSQKVLAEKVGVTPQAINMLKKRGGTLPVKKMRKYEEVTGLPREVLYPGIFAA